MDLKICILLFFVYSFIGWILETGYGITKHHKFINRGYLIGPICPIYGCSIVIITSLTNGLNNLFLIFLVVFFISAVAEYITSYAMEKLFEARWWDYSDLKFNINGRICLETLFPFGVLGAFAVYYLNPLLIKFSNNIPTNIFWILALTIILIFILDIFLSTSLIANLKEFSSFAKDNTEEISQKIKIKLQNNIYYYKRLIASFPLLEKRYNIQKWLSNEYKKAKESIKEQISKKSNLK